MDRITHQSSRPRGYGPTSSLRNNSLKHTRKHERRKRGIEPRSKALSLRRTVQPDSADRPRWAARTVRPGTADCPHPSRGLSGQSRGPSVKANRTTRSDPRKTDRPPRPGGPSARVTDRLLLKRGPSANLLQQKPKPNRIESKGAQEHDELATNPSRADRPPAPRGLSARCGQSRKRPTPKVNSPKSSSDFPNG
jgi:hypothetical protein